MSRGWEHVTAADVAKMGRSRSAPAKPSKYRNVKTAVDGITFDSAKEAARYRELRALEQAGEVRRLSVQPRFDLYVHDITVAARLRRAAARLRGLHDPVEPIKVGTYVADFKYEQKGLSASENDQWDRIVEDVKGFKTALYRWKKKHVEAQYGITIREV